MTPTATCSRVRRVATGTVLILLVATARAVAEETAGDDRELRARVAQRLASTLHGFPTVSLDIDYVSGASDLSEEDIATAGQFMADSAVSAIGRLDSLTEDERDERERHARQGAGHFAGTLRSVLFRRLEGRMKVDLFGTDAQIRRLSPLMDDETDEQIGHVALTIQCGPQGVVIVRNARRDALPDDTRRIQVERIRRSVDDIVGYDYSRFMYLTRILPRQLLEDLLDPQAEWTAARAQGTAVLRHLLPSSIDRWPELDHYPGIMSGAFEVTTSLDTGCILRFELKGADGRVVERITWSDYLSDDTGTLPLVVERETWVPGVWSRHVHERFRGRRVGTRRLIPLDVLIPNGAIVTDRRVEPPIQYTRQGRLPPDAELASQSADSAAREVLSPKEATGPGPAAPTVPQPEQVEDTSGGSGWGTIATGAGMLALLGALLWFLGDRDRRSRRTPTP